MSKLVIQGQQSLKGQIKVSGSKNATTPILAACLLIEEEVILDNVPKIRDVEKMIEILKSLNVEVSWIAKNQLKVNSAQANSRNLDEKLMKSMRSSVLFLSPLLSRFGHLKVPEPGGCIIGNRPLDTHFSALEQLGVNIEETKDTKGKREFKLECKKLRGGDVVLPEFSVTATENILMAAVLAQGSTVIKLAAIEPHVQDLIKFLDAAGAKIEEKPGHILIIDGVKKLRGLSHRIIPDQIETGTFAVMAALIGKAVVIYNIEPAHLDIILLKLKQIGVKFELDEDKKLGRFLKILPQNNLKSFKLQVMPYPGFPTDLQAPFSVLATQCEGASLIHDPLFENRMSHILELQKMGARAIVCDPHRALITGPSQLSAYEIKSLNLRAGISLLIAALVAEGETIIHDAEIIDRGYEDIEKRLAGLGAKVKRVG